MTYAPTPTTHARPRRRILLVAVLAVLAFAALGAAVVYAAGRGQSAPVERAGHEVAPGVWQDPTPAQPVAPAGPIAAEPEPPAIKDFKLTPKITDKECFGSAGCNVTFRVDVAYDGLPPDDSTTWLLVYEIGGVEDGPQVGSIELTGMDLSGTEESVSTTSSKKKITLKLTSIERA